MINDKLKGDGFYYRPLHWDLPDHPFHKGSVEKRLEVFKCAF